MYAEFEGFVELERQLKEAQHAAQALHKTLGSLEFNPSDPQDVERAIAEMERLVDEKLGQYLKNPFIEPMIEATKESFRKQIRRSVEEAQRDQQKS
jgi:hypothetical protein